MPPAHRLFDAFGAAARERLRPHTELVNLMKGRVLCEVGDTPRYAYFPVAGMISLVAVTADGHTLEVDTVCQGGLVGISLMLNGPSPSQIVVQMDGSAYRIRGEAFARELRRGEEVYATALTHAHDTAHQLVLSAVCHAFHSLLQRLCRWLLATRDCARVNTLALTQEFVAQMLGVSRPKVSQALVTLEARHVIHQGHGRIHIVDPRGLRQWSCDCYQPTGIQIPLQPPLRHGT